MEKTAGNPDLAQLLKDKVLPQRLLLVYCVHTLTSSFFSPSPFRPSPLCVPLPFFASPLVPLPFSLCLPSSFQTATRGNDVGWS